MDGQAKLSELGGKPSLFVMAQNLIYLGETLDKVAPNPLHCMQFAQHSWLLMNFTIVVLCATIWTNGQGSTCACVLVSVVEFHCDKKIKMAYMGYPHPNNVKNVTLYHLAVM